MDGYEIHKVKASCVLLVGEKTYYLLDLGHVTRAHKYDINRYTWCVLQPDPSEVGRYNIPWHTESLMELVPCLSFGGAKVEMQPVAKELEYERFEVVVVSNAWRDDLERSERARNGKEPFTTFWDPIWKLPRLFGGGGANRWVLWSIFSEVHWRATTKVAQV